MRKEAKKCIKYYLENINSDEYKKYKIKQEIDSTENHKEYIESEKPQWKNRDDYCERK